MTAQAFLTQQLVMACWLDWGHLCHLATHSLAWENGRKLRKCAAQSVLHFATVELVQDAARGESTHGCHTPSIPGITCVFLESNECDESASVERARPTHSRPCMIPTIMA